MHEAETRALRRATVLLLIVSVARWGWASQGQQAPPETDTSVRDELLAASRSAADEESRRAQGLAEGERIDPNRADEVDLDRLPGVGPSVARAISDARDDGTVFGAPEDLLAVRGVGPATLERIRPFLDLSAPPPVRRGSGGSGPRAAAYGAGSVVDVNRADLAVLQTLPGVGPAIAGRIVAARREQMFTSLDDLVRVRGIGPATVERLRPHATVGRRP